MLGEKQRRALRPDAQAFDEIRMITVPRYKTSGLSGDEWRISVTVQFYRKGKQVYENHHGTVEAACGLMYSNYLKCAEHDQKGELNGGAYFAGEGDLCDQEGCDNPSEVTYKLKAEYCRQGHRMELDQDVIRKFCDEHKKRGDCGLEDADANYTAI